jgi:hypothetical protein
VLCQALDDLLRLLVRMNVQGQLLARRIATDLLEPVGGTCANGVGGEPDPDTRFADAFDLGEVLPHRFLAKAREATPRVRNVKEHELDPCCGSRFSGGVRLRDPEVVELSDGRIPRREHLSVRGLVGGADELGCLPLGLREHRLAPGPEVAACGTPAQAALEGVAVRVHEARKSERARHARDASRGGVLFRRVLG